MPLGMLESGQLQSDHLEEEKEQQQVSKFTHREGGKHAAFYATQGEGG